MLMDSLFVLKPPSRTPFLWIRRALFESRHLRALPRGLQPEKWFAASVQRPTDSGSDVNERSGIAVEDRARIHAIEELVGGLGAACVSTGPELAPAFAAITPVTPLLCLARCWSTRLSAPLIYQSLRHPAVAPSPFPRIPPCPGHGRAFERSQGSTGGNSTP